MTQVRFDPSHWKETVEIRRFKPGDETALFHVYFTAIHELASHDYSHEQIAAWAPANFDMVLWANRIQAIQPFVALLGNDIVGYADMQPDGYIDHFFVSGSRPRQGIGTRLMSRIHEEAASLGLSELRSRVSKTAQPFFALHGFRIVERGFPIVRGVALENALMRKGLAPPPRGI